ncbi:MAG: hypothetical protein KatS3mg087_1560 [Patescibacteria group bacterium]|nr:MAG: hypothetical protein KatS3mg087_1560 [Patescibacteria group bacterium]
MLLDIIGDRRAANRLFEYIKNYAQTSNPILSQYRNVAEMRKAFINQFFYRHYEEPLETHFRRQGVEDTDFIRQARQPGPTHSALDGLVKTAILSQRI